MAVDTRIRELDTRRQSLDRAIDAESRSPCSDQLRVTALKRRKLKLKEEAEALRGDRSH